MGTYSIRAHARGRWRNRNTCGGRAWPSSGQGPAWPGLCEPGGCGEGGDQREGDRARLLVALQRMGVGGAEGQECGDHSSTGGRAPLEPGQRVSSAVSGGHTGRARSGRAWWWALPIQGGPGFQRERGAMPQGSKSVGRARGSCVSHARGCDPRRHHAGAGSWETGPVRLPVESEQGPRGA